MTQPILTRRRMIAITAALSASALLPRGAIAGVDGPVRWSGSVLGAQGSIEIFHPDRRLAQRLVHDALVQVRRLEQLFSLYQPDSAICTLNRSGVLAAPDPDMVTLLKASLEFAALTDGAFDPTVQPLWALDADFFASERASADGPSQSERAEALAKVGYRGLLVDADRVALLKPGAGITLNGIAQGYATDRVVEMLRRAGLSTSLVNMGEIRAIGARPDGTPWRVGLDDPERSGAITETIDLVDRAVATSAGSGFSFDSQGRFTHLFDPATGRSPSLYRTVSVVAPTATEADALSTAFSAMPMDRIAEVVRLRAGVRVHAMDSAGRLKICGA
ncbi:MULTISPECIES: FAD:protein FMN transferase [Rhodopseudomonas]|uniref:FAD:protein FMN transferase n=1 Tax=Rhodopseudomonas palustris TaxID=1076 RepID=A0A0D7E9D7_RHOPL|nr:MULTISPECIES: FAD:protein FMN transferase [Rhodopseudomonas]KIZ37469.1 thiamine biosynthesis protein ApbE [Rhodopseudomonas palustris]MDF3809327.1 FAD:protein FMN transferase [Rhodopseudomonas sp. BAL398]WOK16998.1 FAD:protein FMN transferase [Rhodopseudomonas sp. BAL398]